LVGIFPHLLTLPQRKKFTHESSDYLRKAYRHWAKNNELQAPCFKHSKKQIKGL